MFYVVFFFGSAITKHVRGVKELNLDGFMKMILIYKNLKHTVNTSLPEAPF